MDSDQTAATGDIRWSSKFCQRGSNFGVFFLVNGGRKDQNTTISEPSSARQWMFRWRTDVGPTLNTGLIALGFFQGIRIVLLVTLHCCDFSGGGGGGGPTPSSSSGSAHGWSRRLWVYSVWPRGILRWHKQTTFVVIGALKVRTYKIRSGQIEHWASSGTKRFAQIISRRH